MLTERDISVISALARYFVLSRAQITRRCYPEDNTGAVTRRRLAVMVEGKWISRYPTPVFNVNGGSPWPVYFPAKRGVELVAGWFDDESYLAACCRTPPAHHLLHWLAVSQTHMEIEQAIKRQAGTDEEPEGAVRLDGWFNEWDTVNFDEPEHDRRYRIFTLLREHPRLVCAPDAAFMLSVGGHSKVLYLEQDRGTCSVRRIAAVKAEAYAWLVDRRLHRRHFPQTTLDEFSVLSVSPNAKRRDSVRRAIRGKDRADLWKFIAAPDLRPETFLHEPILYRCDSGPHSLVKPQAINAGAPATESESSSSPAASQGGRQ